jgi:aminopeptidase-like protein
MMDLLAYCDGNHDLLTIADMIDVPMWELVELAERLKANGLLH